MRKYLFLIILVLCITIGWLGNNTISVSLYLTDQDGDSKTKESTEIYTSNTLLDTEETKIEEQIQDPNKEIEVDSIKEEKKSIYEFLKFSNDIPYENIKTAEEQISKLPKNIVDRFYEKKWRKQITNENLSNKFFDGAYKTVIGVTVTASKQIYIQNNKNSIQKSLIHEFGHYIDWHSNYPSNNLEFKQIYNKEVKTFKSKITNSSCVSNEKEFFAHTFYYSIKDESKCTPRALELIQRYVNNI